MEYPVMLGGGVSILVRALLEILHQRYRIFLISDDPSRALLEGRIGEIVFGHLSWNPHGRCTHSVREGLKQWVEANRIEIAHFHAGAQYAWGNRFPGASIPALFASVGVPCVWTTHLTTGLLNGYVGPQRSLLTKIATLPVAWIGKLNQMWSVVAEVAVSEHDKHFLRSSYFPAANRVTMLYHSRLFAQQTNNAPDIIGNRTIFNVGHIAWRKGQHVLFDAFAMQATRLEPWTLEFVGPDSGDGCAAYIRHQIDSLRLQHRVLLRGDCPDPMNNLMRAGVYVQPSLNEALGLALQEAMSLGIPPIASRIGGIPEMVQHGTCGTLVPAGDIAALSTALVELCFDPAARLRFGEASKKRIMGLGMTRDAMATQYENLYRQAFACRDSKKRLPILN